MNLFELESKINQYLQIGLFKDYAPNGLQIEGKDDVQTIVTGVTASMALIERALELNADAIIVHHGYFWPNEPQVLTGMKGRRIRKLIENKMSLLAYHLPLDAHPIVGNNVQLGQMLGINNIATIDEHDPQCLIFHGYLSEPQSSNAFAQNLQTVLQRPPIVTHQKDSIHHIAWCTGGAQNYIQQAIAYGVDAFISGEISEHTTHTARENDVVYFSAGHHATERYGIKALGQWLQQEHHELNVHFVDIDNPA